MVLETDVSIFPLNTHNVFFESILKHSNFQIESHGHAVIIMWTLSLFLSTPFLIVTIRASVISLIDQDMTNCVSSPIMFDKDRFLYSIQPILQKPIESNVQFENVKYYTVLISVEDEIVEERVVSKNLQGEYNLPQVK